VNSLFADEIYNQRIYIYSKKGDKIELPYKDCIIRYYKHSRATKPYFIFRIASVSLIKRWKNIVNEMLGDKDSYQFILAGFFAGEGNIHGGKRGVRVLRISQKTKKDFIDNLLNHFNLQYSFAQDNRNYVISNKSNWDIFAKHKLADLHPKKKDKFWSFYNGFKEEHYKRGYLKDKVLSSIDIPRSTHSLASNLKRSKARISEILIGLKKEGKAMNYKVESIDYWTANRNVVVISKVKDKYLHLLGKEKTTMELARDNGVDWKSSFKRLNELNKLGLVRLKENKKWEKINSEKRIWVI
jgi:hypothetical protein